MVLGPSNPATCVVGFGARTSVGPTALASAAAVRAAVAMFADHPYLIDKNGLPMVVARDAFVAEEVLGVDRFVELGLPTAGEAVAPLFGKSGPSVHALIGLPAERPGLPSRLAEQVTERFRLGLSAQVRLAGVQTISTGSAAGLMALEEARKLIANGSAECCLVGGIESYLEPETLEWLDEHDRLHSASNSWGFIPGEAAGFCLFCSPDFAARRGLSVFGQVMAATTTTESKLITNPEEVCLGKGLTKAFREVLAALPSRDAKVDGMIGDLNGEPYRGDEFGYTIVRTSDRFVSAGDFDAPAECWGDVGAASGVLFIVLATIAARKGYSKGPHTLVWTSADAGQRSAALLKSQNSMETK
jgi:3-oxoacyl-[acyl-carrier-protein] synthase-1